MSTPITGGEIVRPQTPDVLPYLRVAGTAVERAIADEVDANNELYVTGDLVSGEYGVTACNVIIPNPAPKPFYFSVEEGPLSNLDGPHVGFAAVRLVLAPTSVDEVLKRDRHLGPALIDKACLDGVVPDGWAEESELWIAEALGSDIYDNKFEPLLEAVKCAYGLGQYTLFRYYASWHRWQEYNSVDAVLRQAAIRTVNNFDHLLSVLMGPQLPRTHDFRLSTPARSELEP